MDCSIIFRYYLLSINQCKLKKKHSNTQHPSVSPDVWKLGENCFVVSPLFDFHIRWGSLPQQLRHGSRIVVISRGEPLERPTDSDGVATR